jgi:ParB family chromosome partitioning protein
MRFAEVEIGTLRSNPYQPREKMEEEALGELMESIRQMGLLHPPLVAADTDHYKVLAGHQRVEACRRLQMKTIPVWLIPSQDPLFWAQAALVENLQRHDLNPLEIARALSKLQKEFGYTHETLAHLIGKKRATVTHFLRLLILDPEVQKAVETGALSMGHAKCLAPLSALQQQYWVKKMAKQPLSVHDLEKQLSKPKLCAAPTKTTTLELREKLVETFRLRADAFVSETGKGWMKLYFQKPEDLWLLWEAASKENEKNDKGSF